MYVLSWYDDLITGLVSPTGPKPFSSKQEYAAMLEQIAEQNLVARRRINADIFEFDSPLKTTNYITLHLNRAVKLADMLASLMSEEDMITVFSITAAPSSSNFYKTLYTSLASLEHFIKSHLPPISFKESQVSAINRVLEAKQLWDRAIWLKAALEQAGVDTHVVSLALKPVEDLKLLPRTSGCTTERLEYLKEHVLVLEELVADKEKWEKTPDEEMIRSLYYMNFNTYAFFDYCKDYILNDLRQLDTRAEREEKMAWYTKLNTNYFLRPHMAMYPEHIKPSIKLMLKGWLSEEAAWLLRQPEWDNAGPENIKMPTNLPVTSLALMFKLFQMHGSMKPPTDAFLVRFACDSFSSSRSANMGQESFRKKLYEKDPATFADLRSFLHDIIKLSITYEKSF
jgi:hypothetical protein